MRPATSTPPSILLVDDDPGDIVLTQRALKHGRVNIPVEVANDGVEAMQFLRGEGRYKNANRPSLILLDLNLPKKDGRETLAEIKADESLRKIPVVVLTTSDAESDINFSYEMQANCYLTKPEDLAQFRSVIKAVSEFWLSVATLPPE